MGRLLKWVTKQEQKKRNSGVRDFVVNYYIRNVNQVLPVSLPDEDAIEAIDRHWESGALKTLEIDALMTKISGTWRTKIWTDKKLTECVKRVGWLEPEEDKVFIKMQKEWGLEVGEAINECIKRAKEDFDREKQIRKDVREEWRQKFAMISDKAEKAISKNDEALKTVPIGAQQELRELRLEVGSLRAKLADAMSWRNSDYKQRNLDLELDRLKPTFRNAPLSVGIAEYGISINKPYKSGTNFGVNFERSRGYFDEINFDSLK